MKFCVKKTTKDQWNNWDFEMRNSSDRHLPAPIEKLNERSREELYQGWGQFDWYDRNAEAH